MSKKGLAARKLRKKNERRESRLAAVRKNLHSAVKSIEELKVANAAADSGAPRLAQLKREAKPVWGELLTRLSETLVELKASLESAELPTRIAECDSALAQEKPDHRSADAATWKVTISRWCGMIAKEQENLSRCDRKSSTAALKFAVNAWEKIRRIHDAFHVFEDEGSPKQFDLSEAAHESVHETIFDLERIFFYRHAWGEPDLGF